MCGILWDRPQWWSQYNTYNNFIGQKSYTCLREICGSTAVVYSMNDCWVFPEIWLQRGAGLRWGEEASGQQLGEQLGLAGGHDESSEIAVGADARSKAAAIVCLAGQCWVAVHKALWPGSLALFLLDVPFAGYLVMSSGCSQMSEWGNEWIICGHAKPSQAKVLTGAETCAKRKSTYPR
jgi:hypothetical protein